ncbi:MAG: hypothetical protein HUJ11_06395 [Arenibacter algicola]|nr:hypothetical protein [Arenibacter algicola]
MKISQNSQRAIWFGFGLVCFLLFVIVISTQLQEPQTEQRPGPLKNQRVQYDILRDIDQAPIRRMLTVMLPRRTSEYDLKVVSNQIRYSLPEHTYKFISIRFHVPDMPVDGDVWARAAFYYDKPEEITIHGSKLEADSGK